jgi:anti-sigma regulatory factor (Ser/Thr protein kinase)
MDMVEIRLPSDPKLLKIVRATISHLCEVIGFSAEIQNGVTLAVDEACTNVIKHAYGNQTDRPIIITCKLFGDRLEVVIRDYGQKADLNKIKSRELEDVRPGGLGVHLIRSVMDVVVYDSSPARGNRLTLAKYLPTKKEA